MLDKLNIEFGLHQNSLRLSQQRQIILASNIANADTPGYLARDIDFSQLLKQQTENYAKSMVSKSVSIKKTSSLHIENKLREDEVLLQYRNVDQPSVDGNTVDMDRERMNFSDNSVKYQVSLTLLNAQMKDLLSVINRG